MSSACLPHLSRVSSKGRPHVVQRAQLGHFLILFFSSAIKTTKRLTLPTGWREDTLTTGKLEPSQPQLITVLTRPADYLPGSSLRRRPPLTPPPLVETSIFDLDPFEKSHYFQSFLTSYLPT